MSVQLINISELTVNPNNPRIIKDEKFDKLVQSIKEFPDMLKYRPIVVDENNVILGGNMRFKACKAAKLKQVPIMKASELTEAQKREFIIKDNVSGGEWDWAMLQNEWDTEQLDAWGVDVPDFEPEQELEAIEDDYEIPDEIQTDIVLGDLFEIGEHRLLCGDSTDSDAVAKLLNGMKPELILTDPPYSSGGYQESGKTSGSIGARGNKKIATDNLSTRGYIALMDKVLASLGEAHSAFIFCDWKMWVYNQDIAEAKGFRVRNMIVWDKMQMGMGMPFRNQHELCLFGSKIAGKIGNGNTPNVLSVKRDREAEHATPKPIELINRLLQQIESENVIDPFLGGGSTMVASHQLKRKCYGMELDPKYCQVILDRMIKLDPTLTIKRNGHPYLQRKNSDAKA
jgi:DNA modification methylase